jgi:flagellin-like hook-associated protein FlgL
MDDVIKGINSYNSRYNRKYTNIYNGYYQTQAVDIIDTGSNMKVSNSIASALVSGQNLDATLKADYDGIWIVDALGNTLSGSKKTWNDLGITSWDSLSDISDTYTYQYKFSDNNYNIEYNFTLLNETSIDSVIEGINNATISTQETFGNNCLVVEAAPNSNILSLKVDGTNDNTLNNVLTIQQEALLGRDFDVATGDITSQSLDYDSSKYKFLFNIKDASGNTVISVKDWDQEAIWVSSSEYTDFFTSYMENNNITNCAKKYLAYETALKVKQLFGGNSSDKLEDAIGIDKISDISSLSDSILIDNNVTNTTYGLKTGQKYYCTEIDFSGLGTDFQLYDLLGTGMSSHVGTSNYMKSILFTWGESERTSSSGYGYTCVSNGDISGTQKEYTLCIDLKSLTEKGINNGTDFTNALIDIVNSAVKTDGSSATYLQLAANQDKLYVCSDNTTNATPQGISFETNAFEVNVVPKKKFFHDSIHNTSPSLTVMYKYNLSKVLDSNVSMQQDTYGDYVFADGVYKKFIYSDYYNSDGTLKSGQNDPERYNLNVSSNVSNWADFYNEVMSDIATNTLLTFKSTDYDYVNYAADENDNSATVSTFRFEAVDNKTFWIQAGANAKQGIAMTWDTFNTWLLGIGNDDVLEQGHAENLIAHVDNALEKINHLRSTFGAYTNRMEHAYANATNTSENLQYAESRIRDADMAEESVSLARATIIEQAGISMLTQANQMTSGILSLLQ